MKSIVNGLSSSNLYFNDITNVIARFEFFLIFIPNIFKSILLDENMALVVTGK